jgi:hypothetical protein
MEYEKFESDTLTKIIPALIKAQQEMETIEKDGIMRVAGRPDRSYATIGSIIGTIKESLMRNEILLTQPLIYKDNTLFLYTNMRHSSGEYINSRVIMYKNNGDSDQDFGKSVTYARKYAAMAAVGVSPDEDDDGQSQQEKPQYTSTSSDKITEPQLKMLRGRIQKSPELLLSLMEKYNVQDPKDFKKRDFNNILIEIDNHNK